MSKIKRKWKEDIYNDYYNGGGNSIDTYDRKLWRSDKKGENYNSKNGSVFAKVDGVWHILCIQACNWDKNKITLVHGKYKANTSAFLSQLPPTHNYFQIIQEHIPKYAYTATSISGTTFWHQ